MMTILEIIGVGFILWCLLWLYQAIRRIPRYLAKRRLKSSLKPDPLYRKRRLAQFDEARKERYRRNVEAIGL